MEAPTHRHDGAVPHNETPGYEIVRGLGWDFGQKNDDRFKKCWRTINVPQLIFAAVGLQGAIEIPRLVQNPRFMCPVTSGDVTVMLRQSQPPESGDRFIRSASTCAAHARRDLQEAPRIRGDVGC